jgi:hypothetical protein
MKPKLFLFSILFLCFSSAFSQYTPLPALDENEYSNFIAQLRSQAKLQDLPELNTLADNMSYNEARRFMANPYLFKEDLKDQPEDGKPQISKRAFGIVVALLYSSLTGNSSDYNKSRIGFAFGLYTMYALGQVYFLGELLYQQNQLREEGSWGWETYTVNSILLYTAFLYALEANTVKILLGGGLTIGTILSGKDKWDYGGTDTGNEKFEFASDSWKRFYAGLNIVAGIMTQSMMMIYISYTIPFTKLHGDVDWHPAMSFFKLAVLFTLFKK